MGSYDLLLAALASRISEERRLRVRRRIRRLARPAWLGTIRRTEPLSDEWGYDRGSPVDRYYITEFLARHRHLVRGRVLEVKDSGYTRRFGTGVERSDVLDVDAANPDATFVADLADAGSVPSAAFDCFIVTQTLQYVYDVRAAVEHIHRVLRPGGSLLCTVPCVSRIAPEYTDHWRFTAASCSRLFGDVFGNGELEVSARGNVLVSVAFLVGMARDELSTRELETDDPYFPLLVTVRATKAGSES